MNKTDYIFISIIIIIIISVIFTYFLYNSINDFKETFENIEPEKNKPTLNIDAVIYINLDSRKDRNDEILNEIRNIGIHESKIHRLSAVKRTWGALGCALSHEAVLNFIIEKDGTISNIKIDKSRYETEKIENCIIQCFQKMPKWKPAEQSGKPIRISWREPVIISTSN